MIECPQCKKSIDAMNAFWADPRTYFDMECPRCSCILEIETESHPTFKLIGFRE